MFRNGNDNLVAFMEMCFPIAAGNEVQGFRRIANEDDFLRRFGIDKAAYCFAGFIVQFACFNAQDMGATMGIAIVVFQEIYDSVNNLVRLLRCRCVVKINDLMSVMDFSQDGEISAYI